MSNVKYKISCQCKIYGSTAMRVNVRKKVEGGWLLVGSWNVPRLHPYTGERLSTQAKRLAYIVDNFIEVE